MIESLNLFTADRFVVDDIHHALQPTKSGSTEKNHRKEKKRREHRNERVSGKIY